MKESSGFRIFSASRIPKIQGSLHDYELKT